MLYVALGDSVAVGWKAPGGLGYVTRLWRALQRDGARWGLRNLASLGGTTVSLLRSQVPRALAAHPDLITVDIGGNDLRRFIRNPGPAIPWITGNLGRALQRLRQSGAPIFVADVYNPYPKGSRLHEYGEHWLAIFNRELGQTVARHGAVLVPIHRVLAQADGRVIAPDNLHPNGRGHELIAAAFLKAGVARLAGQR
ncbi:MAG: SGNH/GDSL hydrolase family protein [Chitinophagales bacterium]